MFEKKERDIDKANIKIEVLKWQLKELMGMHGEAINECDAALDDARRLRKELREYKELEPKLQKEADRLHLLLQERRHPEFGLGRDERKRLHDELEGSRSLLEKSQSYRVSNANEIKRLRNETYRLRTKYIKAMKEHKDAVQEQNTLLTDKKRFERYYDDIAGLYSRLLQECDSLLTDKKNLEKKNQGLELDIEGMKGDYKDIVTECGDLIHEREGFLMGERLLENDKKDFIELELSGEVMMLLDEMAHELPEAFTTRDKGYAACVEKLVINGCTGEAKKE